MDTPEWHDLTALFVSLIALIVSGIAAANQLASLKKPLPAVGFIFGKRIVPGAHYGDQDSEDVVAATVIIRITNRGHEPMFRPALYDWTPNSAFFLSHYNAERMPPALGPGESLERPLHYSLNNKHERSIGVVWEEASLFGREPVIAGIRFRLKAIDPEVIIGAERTAIPDERWKRVGPLFKKGWQRSGSPWSLWQPVLSGGPKTPGEGIDFPYGANNIQEKDIKDFHLIFPTLDGGGWVPSRQDITPEQVAHYRKLGEALSGD